MAHLPAEIRSIGPRDPNFFPVRALAGEALLGVNEHSEAASVIAQLEHDAGSIECAWGLALASRSRALLIASQGDLEGALRASQRALDWHATLAFPFELGRTLLWHGTIQRRAKLKRPARQTLERAVAIFADLGAPLWLERARAERGRIGGRQPASADGLTATEE